MRTVTVNPASASLTWLAGDHLGSTSVTLDASGNVAARLLYTPCGAWGETRYSWGSTPTAYHFTSQYEQTGPGSLYNFNARF